ncbi:Pycsar system effector family protein [Glycomyces mayteni]|uniref:Pycsar system effector family protein n=1 Tax=Glycomyces mayteni TaxID=543887 RepID=A0ABW2D5K9_9ACTN
MADIRDVVEDGAYLIGLVRSLVEYSGFDPNDFVLAGSARLLHDRVIDGISDIDIVARGASLDLAFDLTFQDHHGGIELGEQTGDKIARLFGGKVNVSARWLRGLGSADELIQRADVFDGLRYLSLPDVVGYKRKLGREKDREDLAAIERHFSAPDRESYRAMLLISIETSEVALSAPHPELVKAALAEIHRQIDHARINVSHADTKAALLAAGAIPIAAVLIAAPSLTRPLGLHSTAAWTAAVFLFLGIFMLGMVVWPRLSGGSGIKTGARRKPSQIIETALRVSASPERKLKYAAAELSLLATLAYVKYRRIQAAILCFAVAAVFMVVAAIG